MAERVRIGTSAWVNNDANGYALDDAQTLRRLIQG